MNIDRIDRINSATKYPSILTYHAMGERGRLTEEVQVPLEGELVVTEKVDGTNARLIQLPFGGTWIAGSREELLHASGDLIHNPSLGIVDALRPIAARLPSWPSSEGVRVFFFEVYGGNIGSNAKQYTSTKAVGVRIFDVATIPISVLEMERDSIAAWRDAGGQAFEPESMLRAVAASIDVPLTPRLFSMPPLPRLLSATLEWLAGAIGFTQVALDDMAGKRSEGVVVRTLDRSRIAKLRFEDYERTLKRKK